MVRIALIEDESDAMNTVKEYLEKYSSEAGTEYRMSWYTDPREFLAEYTANAFDLVFMDIKLPGMNGMTAAQKLRSIDSSVVLVFITNMAQFAIKGYEVDATDFMVKTLSYHDFSLKFARVLKKIKNNRDVTIAVTGKGTVKYIPAKEVVYVEVVKHQLYYHSPEGVYEVRGTMKKAEEDLGRLGFARCNNYCLVNLRYVTGVVGFDLTVSLGGNSHETLVISHPRKKDFVKALNEYLGENM